MALVLTQVSSWTSKRPEKRVGKAYGNYYLLNTNRMVDIIAYDTGTQFKYLQAPDDHRCSWDTIITDKTVDQLRTAHDDPPDSKLGAFLVFPTLDMTRVTVDTPTEMLIPWENIDIVWQTPRDFTLGCCHLTYYTESWKRVTVIVDFDTLTEVLGEQNAAPV